MNKLLIVVFYSLVLQVGTPNPAQINQRSGTRFGGGLDPILLTRCFTGQSSAGMSIVSSVEDCITHTTPKNETNTKSNNQSLNQSTNQLIGQANNGFRSYQDSTMVASNYDGL